MVCAKGWSSLNKRQEPIIRELDPEDYDGVRDLLERGYMERTEESVDWSLQKSPIFRKNLTSVAELDGKIVGCRLMTVQHLKITNDLVIPASSGLVVVHPDYRRKGIARDLLGWVRGRLQTEEGGIPLAFGISSSEVYRTFWSRIDPATVIEDRAISYTRILSLVPIRKAAESANLKLEGGEGTRRWGLEISILLEIIGMPAFILKIDRGTLRVETDTEMDITFRGKLRSLSPFSIVVAWLRGELKVSGLRHAWKLLFCHRILRSFASNLLQEEQPVLPG